MKKVILMAFVVMGLILGFTGCPTPSNPTKTQYKLTYASDYGTAPAVKKVPEGYVLSDSDLPLITADGWVFCGWTANNTAVIPGMKVQSDMLLTAAWNEYIPTYTLSYLAEHGVSPSSKTVEDGYILTSDDLPVLVDVKGWRFTGWNVNVGDVIRQDTIITASWVETCVISYDCGFNCYSIPAKTVDKGYILTSADFPIVTPTRYYPKWSGGTVGTIVDRDITLKVYAEPCPSICYITEHGKAPYQKDFIPPYTLTEADFPILPDVDGWHFIGWKQYKVGDVLRHGATLFAIWEQL